MALSDLQIFSEYVYTAQREVLMQKIELFNAATRGCIALRVGPMEGDFRTEAFWGRVQGLVRRRNPYTNGAQATKELKMLTDVMVKIAAGTPPIDIPPSMFRWIQQNPEEGGALIGQQLAVDTLADMLNISLLAAVAAMSGQDENIFDITSEPAPFTTGKMTHPVFNSAQALYGDSYQDILVWVMHSKPLFDVYADAMSNSHFLFNFGTIAVKEDSFGRAFVISDSPSLFSLSDSLASGRWSPVDSPDSLVQASIPSPGNPDYVYASLGLTAEGIRIDQNSDFDDNVVSLNGLENIARTYQAEWSYNLGIRGFAWNTVNGARAPNDAALATSTNWVRYATSSKSLAGVLIKSH